MQGAPASGARELGPHTGSAHGDAFDASTLAERLHEPRAFRRLSHERDPLGGFPSKSVPLTVSYLSRGDCCGPRAG